MALWQKSQDAITLSSLKTSGTRTVFLSMEMMAFEAQWLKKSRQFTNCMLHLFSLVSFKKILYGTNAERTSSAKHFVIVRSLLFMRKQAIFIWGNKDEHALLVGKKLTLYSF